MRLLRLCRSSANILLPTILFFRIQRCNSFPLQPRSHTGPFISSFGCFSKSPRIPMLSYTPNRALFSFQRSTTLGGGRVTLTRDSSGTPTEKLLHAKGIQAPRLLPAAQGRLPAITLASPPRQDTKPDGEMGSGCGFQRQDMGHSPREDSQGTDGERSHLGPYPGTIGS